MLNPNAKPFEIRRHPKRPSLSSNKSLLITPPLLKSASYLVCPLGQSPHPHPTIKFVWNDVSSVTFFSTRMPLHAHPCKTLGNNKAPCPVNWIWRPKTAGTMDNNKAVDKIKSSSPYDFGEYIALGKPPCSVNWVWRPRTGRTRSDKAVVKTKSSAPYDFDEYEAQLQCKTTVMFKNIPNRFSKKEMLGYLDKHCAEENNKLKKTEDSVESAYDFVYLPMDFRTGVNLGYAFVNFTSVPAAVRFFRAYHDFKWGVVHHSPKVCEIKYARIQGRGNLERHFRKSRFICNTEEYLPTVFSPPRNGANSTKTEASAIGKLSVRRPKTY